MRKIVGNEGGYCGCTVLSILARVIFIVQKRTIGKTIELQCSARKFAKCTVQCKVQRAIEVKKVAIQGEAMQCMVIEWTSKKHCIK